MSWGEVYKVYDMYLEGLKLDEATKKAEAKTKEKAKAKAEAEAKKTQHGGEVVEEVSLIRRKKRKHKQSIKQNNSERVNKNIVNDKKNYVATRKNKINIEKHRQSLKQFNN